MHTASRVATIDHANTQNGLHKAPTSRIGLHKASSPSKKLVIIQITSHYVPLFLFLFIFECSTFVLLHSLSFSSRFIEMTQFLSPRLNTSFFYTYVGICIYTNAAVNFLFYFLFQVHHNMPQNPSMFLLSLFHTYFSSFLSYKAHSC